ncbi:hypothetical protein MKW92_051322 [Papaver armeniacum]|nr:hypothetical protein MKW92_051322 [Papaver armeniacum]
MALATKAVTEVFYKLLMQRNSVYIPAVLAGAFAGETAVDYGVKKLWDVNNVGSNKLSDVIHNETHTRH